MKKKVHPIWPVVSLVLFGGIAYFGYHFLQIGPKYGSMEAEDLWKTSFQMPLLFLILFLFRHAGAYKLAVLIYLMELIWATLSPISFVELTVFEPILILWLPALLIARFLFKRGDFQRRRNAYMLAVALSYLILPVITAYAGMLSMFYQYIVPLYF